MTDFDTKCAPGETQQSIEDAIFETVSEKVLKAMKVFRYDENNRGFITTDSLKKFLEYCDLKMDD